MKPYYEQDGITIYHGDCREMLHLLPRDAAIVSDPPYGISFQHSGYTAGGKYAGSKRTTTRKAPIHNHKIAGDDQPFDPTPWLEFPTVVLWGADHYSNRLPRGRWLTWDKLGGKESWDSFGDCEHAWVNRVGATRIYRYMWKGLCQGAGEDKGTKRTHPTQKPVGLMRWCFDVLKIPTDTVIVDPYAGSGSTLVAAKTGGYRAIGVEIEERYCEIAAKRLAQGVLFGAGGAA